MDNSLLYSQVKPDKSIAAFTDSFWMLQNTSHRPHEVIILPDGRIDLFLSRRDDGSHEITLLGLGTAPERATIAPGALTFAISFNLPATEYILQTPVAGLVNSAHHMPPGFWGFKTADLDDFPAFCAQNTQRIKALLPAAPDSRKMALFDMLYAAQGNITVKELSEKVFWSARQINRYFHDQYGMALKTYCSILRFRSSFQQIKKGRLFPEEGFADQAHFIKQIRKFSGAAPGELYRNANGRFIQFSTLRQS